MIHRERERDADRRDGERQKRSCVRRMSLRSCLRSSCPAAIEASNAVAVTAARERDRRGRGERAASPSSRHREEESKRESHANREKEKHRARKKFVTVAAASCRRRRRPRRHVWPPGSGAALSKPTIGASAEFFYDLSWLYLVVSGLYLTGEHHGSLCHCYRHCCRGVRCWVCDYRFCLRVLLLRATTSSTIPLFLVSICITVESLLCFCLGCCGCLCDMDKVAVATAVN